MSRLTLIDKSQALSDLLRHLVVTPYAWSDAHGEHKFDDRLKQHEPNSDLADIAYR